MHQSWVKSVLFCKSFVGNILLAKTYTTGHSIDNEEQQIGLYIAQTQIYKQILAKKIHNKNLRQKFNIRTAINFKTLSLACIYSSTFLNH